MPEIRQYISKVILIWHHTYFHESKYITEMEYITGATRRIIELKGIICNENDTS